MLQSPNIPRVSVELFQTYMMIKEITQMIITIAPLDLNHRYLSILQMLVVVHQLEKQDKILTVEKQTVARQWKLWHDLIH